MLQVPAALASLEDAWISTPHIRPDHGGPVGRDYVPFPDPATAQPIVATLADVARRNPDGVCLHEGSCSMTFDGLLRQARQLAHLIGTAVPAHGRVGILLSSSSAYVIAVYACLAAGRQAVLMDAAFPPARSAAVVQLAGVDLLLQDGMPALDALDAVARHAPGGAPAPPADWGLDAAAFVLCTSGSTGAPKAIFHSQRTMLHWARTAHEALHVTPEDRVLSLSSMSTLGGFTALLGVPLAGAALQMADLKTLGFAKLLDTVADGPVTILRSTPSMLRAMSQLPRAREALARVRAVQTYGEPLMKADLAALRGMLPAGCLLRTTYGSTEASGLSGFVDANDDHDPLRVAAGTLMPDTQALLVREDGTACAPGESGELWIRSRYNALGELGGPVPARGDDGPGSVVRTGDLARMYADHVFVVLGRKDRMMKINGQRLEPAEIEAVLRANPAVTAAHVVLAPGADAASGPPPRLIAFVTAAPPTAGLSIDALRSQLRAALPAFMMPSRIVCLERMPLLPGGKVDTAALLAAADDARTGTR